ncbi:MAG: endonuclease NucS [bacterium]|nr:endonuclease NucS [bacterium]
MHELITKIIQEKKNDPWWIESEKKVLERYGSLFNFNNIKNITQEEFKSFLLIKHNYHWEGIHRQQGLITSDMQKLKKALTILLDENKPAKKRLDFLFPKGSENYIKGLGKAVVTPILLVAYPEKYGVWNQKSETALKQLNLFPEFQRGQSFSDKYLKVNHVLNELKEKYAISLWQLDGIMGEIAGNSPFPTMSDEEATIDAEIKEHGLEYVYNFGMEKHLEDFLIANWDKTEIGKKYELIYEEGDLVSQQYQTDVGYIDILANDKSGNTFLVIELKKGRSSDSVVGQILRYMGWVRKELANGQKVKGLVIVPDVDKKLELSLSDQKDINLMTYKIDFKLSKYESDL